MMCFFELIYEIESKTENKNSKFVFKTHFYEPAHNISSKSSLDAGKNVFWCIINKLIRGNCNII